jgi:hypothetical protein
MCGFLAGPVTVVAKTPVSLDQVNRAMKMASLTDAFYYPKPDYRLHADQSRF